MTRPPAAAIVVDAGGTSTRIGMHVGGRLVDTTSFRTPSRRLDPSLDLATVQAHLFDRIAEEANRLRCSYQQATDLGLALGAVVTNAGVVRNASTLWLGKADGFDTVAALTARLPWARVTVLNDVSAAAWSFRSLGRFVLVTVSTGVAIKVFDDDLPVARKLMLDADGLGGEMGHTVVEPLLVEERLGSAAAASALGRAAAAGDPAARAELHRAGLPWCECGTVADLCSYASGPAVERAARRLARAHPGDFGRSRLAALCTGDPDGITTATLAAAARAGDPLADRLLHGATRHLASRIVQLCADLGLRTVVVVGGLAHGVGAPWFGALRRNVADLVTDAGWFTGWRDRDVEALVHVPAGDVDSVCLTGMGLYLEAARAQARELVKPVGERRLHVVRRPAPVCGRQQFLARTVFAGICSTDLQIMHGERGCEPGVLGHECVAEVVEVGGDVRGLQPGVLIGINPNHPSDQHDKIGHNQPGVLRDLAAWDGHLLDRGQAIELPVEGRAEWVLLELLAGVVRAQDAMADRWDGRDVLVVGAGVAGLAHALLARSRGAGRVLVANRSRARRQLALVRGGCLEEDLVTLDGDPVQVDAAIVAVTGAGGPDVLDRLWSWLADGAAVHLFGGFPGGSRVNVGGGETVDAARLRSQGDRATVRTPTGRAATLIGTRGGRGCDYEAARDLCTGPGGLDLAPLVTHVASLDALPAVMGELAREGTVSGEPALRVVVDLRLPGAVVRGVAPGDVPALG